VGTLKNSNVKYSSEHNFTWTSESATALGIPFYNKHQDTLKYNMNKKINDFRMTLKQWSHRNLTLMGKVTIIENLQRDIFKFIWNSKPDKVKRSILLQGYEYGGL